MSRLPGRDGTGVGAGRTGGVRAPRLHVVTDDDVLARADFADRARAVLAAGGPRLALHLRGPRATGRALFERARDLREPARVARARLVVNDRVDVALVLGLDGVHLGGRSLPAEVVSELVPGRCMLGVSVHAAEEARSVARAGPDYLMVGTVFATPSHPGRSGRGTDLVRSAVGAVDVPVVAIGGVTPDRVAEVTTVGAHGVAVLRGVWNAPDSGEAVAAYLEALGRATHG